MIVVEMEFGQASGNGFDDCCAIAYRFEHDRGMPDHGESWVIQTEGGAAHGLHGGLMWFLGLWRSPAGHVYVANNDGRLHMNHDPKPRAAPWDIHTLPCNLEGVWGIDDSFVMAWGRRKGAPHAFRWDGSGTWHEIPEPPGLVLAAHGIAPDLVYVVGQDGMIGRWDGSRWHRTASPVQSNLVDVFVASQDEMYAVSSDGRLLEGSINGWSHMLDRGDSLDCIAKWNGKIWVGSQFDGIFELQKKKLVSVKPAVKATNLEARGPVLLASTPGFIGSTTNGKTYNIHFRKGLEPVFAGKDPAWAPAGEPWENMGEPPE
jgi:hypothetical protein